MALNLRNTKANTPDFVEVVIIDALRTDIQIFQLNSFGYRFGEARLTA